MYKKITGFMILLLFVAAGNAYAYDVPMAKYKDIMEQSWEKDYVYTLSALGIIEGYPDSKYHSEEALSREAFIKLLVTAAKLDISQTSGTVPADAVNRWSAPYIAAASERHWIEFMVNEADEFKPEQPITREEVAAVVGMYLLDKDESVGPQWISGDWSKERDARAYSDIQIISNKLAPYVFYTINRTVMEGDNQGFRPKSGLIRSEAAAVINRLIDIETVGQELEITGFYAIKSSPAIARMSLVDNVAMGWSHLEYDTAGTAKLGTNTTTYQVPDGFEEVLKAADQANVNKDLMVFFNEREKLAAFLKDALAQKMFISQLVAKLNDPVFGFSGVSLDLEGLIEESDAPNYTQFVRDVKAAIGSKTLSVCIPTDHYYKGYNYKDLSAAADSLILMAYDFTHDDSHLPSAPLPLVRDGVERALKQGVPASKLVLGISKQANQWITTNSKTTTAKPAIELVEKRIADPNASKTWSMPYFLKLVQYQDGSNINEIYYEDTQSIAKKIWLAKVYGLKGISLWHMGNFTASDWDIIAKK
ncbi:glycosyl hydrolase family 18 protein [Paenibacillus radicis (ex Xue et al. 2023)]|uniref:Glycosyl hydrolase family 18 protein n=1 Tax=Paenibacillus radicis (ex Xue et al. 2023) TaxID=2972489 RepID=A0ABT1YDF2_9BACL|nr:glycosyl hydrolase family 18 protein [Paenibacillus radicis (ex Xue et al. 2023)]MCR8630434.1 glycosyl hydrolase family 18 protein [Paenibacillus radicis (ex Xue et al. 2023)]